MLQYMNALSIFHVCIYTYIYVCLYHMNYVDTCLSCVYVCTHTIFDIVVMVVVDMVKVDMVNVDMVVVDMVMLAIF